jgi:hypothetical protein
MESNDAATISPVQYVSTISVLQNDRHLWHLQTLLTTPAIASGSPRCTAMVDTIISTIAIPKTFIMR